MDRIKSIQDFPINFFKCGITGWCLEVIFTSVESIMANDWRLMGRTSLLMFPIYGMGALLGPISTMIDQWLGEDISRPADRYMRHGMIYMVLIFTAEYISGAWLKYLGICPWDYGSSHSNINGLIRLDFAPLWFGMGLLFEQITKKRSR
ncbi:MAG: putative ABC transporter permease [Lachnospiraceae bacterium]